MDDDNESDFNPIKPILQKYDEQMPEERIKGSKIDLNLSARATNTRVFTIHEEVLNYNRAI